MSEDKPFKVFNHGEGLINLSHLKNHVVEMKPTELHLKANGSIEEKESFCIVMTKQYFNSEPPLHCVGQISLAMLNEGLNDLGYEIIRKA